MSEHGAGSDLAAVTRPARSRPTAAGCSTAPRCGPAARTSRIRSWCWRGPARSIRSTATPASASSSCRPTPPGITISPIELMNGEHHFNEVTFADAFVADGDRARRGRQRLAPGHRRAGLRTQWAGTDSVDGDAGVRRRPRARRAGRRRPDGRRGGRPDGPDDLAAPAVDFGGPRPGRRQGRRQPGRDGQGSRHPLRAGVGGTGGRPASTASSRVGDTRRLRDLLAIARLHSPMFTLRGGTNEVLRGVVAKGMGAR